MSFIGNDTRTHLFSWIKSLFVKIHEECLLCTNRAHERRHVGEDLENNDRFISDPQAARTLQGSVLFRPTPM
jgi:hypothetical protein